MSATGKTPPNAAPPSAKPARHERLKAALKANMGRRKAQARERGQKPGGAPQEADETTRQG